MSLTEKEISLIKFFLGQGRELNDFEVSAVVEEYDTLVKEAKENPFKVYEAGLGVLFEKHQHNMINRMHEKYGVTHPWFVKGQIVSLSNGILRYYWENKNRKA